MAKKKKRRPTPAGRSGSVATTTSARRETTTVPAIRPEPGTPGGPNRLARKEEARRQREAIRRRMARRRFLRRAGVVALAVAVVAGVGAYVALKPNPAKAAGCGSVETNSPYDPASQDRAHINEQGVVKTPPRLSTYRTQPPTSGPHDLNPLSAGVYAAPPDVYRTIHSLEHGAVIIWFDPKAVGNAELRKIQSIYQQAANNDHVIVAPYDYPQEGGTLPAGKKMVLVAWHHMQQCTNINLAAANDFVKSYRATVVNGVIDPAYRGDAPEAGSAI
jgi:Protein of unknown function (DUF3105)